MGEKDSTDLEIEKLIELRVRRLFSEDAEKHRKFLETQFNQLKWAIMVLVAIFAIGFGYVFGKSIANIDDTIQSRVDDRIIDYHVDKDVQNKMEARLSFVVDDVLKSQNTIMTIRDRVSEATRQVVDDVAINRVESAAIDAVRNIESLTKDEITHLLANVPIGTVIPSMADPEKVYRLQGLSPGFDPKTSLWAPADGRDVPDSKYAENINISVPDLRGMFLRGLNNIDPSKQPRKDGKQDPDSERKVNSYQSDIIARHEHSLSLRTSTISPEINPGTENFHASQNLGAKIEIKTNSSGNWSGPETRPKNIAVYYYIRIN